jgi:serine/threonine protein phosphatase PrpC
MDHVPCAGQYLLPNARGKAGGGVAGGRVANAHGEKENEDCCVMLSNLWEAAACGDGDQLGAAAKAAAGRVSLVGLFDGHAGDAAARFCAQRLPGRVAARLLGELASASAAAASAAPATAPATVTAATVRAALDEGNAAGRALRAAFLDVEAELAARHAEGLIDGSGSTAVVALITEAAVWVAHAGLALVCSLGVGVKRGPE